MIKQDDWSTELARKESLIETDYVGSNADLRGSFGEAYYDLANSRWNYRPSGGEVFYIVDSKELSCSNDDGWVKGIYSGAKFIPKTGKAYWDEKEELWVYKPNGKKELYKVREEDFKLTRS